MPVVGGKRKRARRRTERGARVGRRKSKNKPTSVVVRTPRDIRGMGAMPIPDRYKCKLRCTHAVLTTFSTAAINTFQLRGNSLFDPNKTGTGHQPYGFDQLAALYDKYKVFGSKVQLIYHSSTDTAASANGIVAVFPTQEDNSPSSITLLMEAPRIKYERMGPMSGSRGSVEITHYCSTAQVEGITEAQLQDEDYGAPVTGNPANEWFWDITNASTDGTTATSGVALVTITYYAEFYGRKNLAQS